MWSHPRLASLSQAGLPVDDSELLMLLHHLPGAEITDSTTMLSLHDTEHHRQYFTLARRTLCQLNQFTSPPFYGISRVLELYAP